MPDAPNPPLPSPPAAYPDGSVEVESADADAVTPIEGNRPVASPAGGGPDPAIVVPDPGAPPPDPMTAGPTRFLFFLRNESLRVSDADLDRLVAAMAVSSDEFCALTGYRFFVRRADAFQNLPAGATIVRIVEQGSDPSAIAWHTENPDGTYSVEVSVAAVLDHGGGVTDGGTAGDSVASAVDHEVKETCRNPHVNLWADRFDGTEGANENCDPVQNAPIVRAVVDPATGATFNALLSNFVTDAWFDPQAKTDGSVAFDAAGLVQAPGVLHSGYMVVRPASPQTNDVWGQEPAGTLPKVVRAKARLDVDHDVVTVHAGTPHERWIVFSKDFPGWKRTRAMARVARLIPKGP